jgi:protein associated with RNAse G/E
LFIDIQDKTNIKTRDDDRKLLKHFSFHFFHKLIPFNLYNFLEGMAVDVLLDLSAGLISSNKSQKRLVFNLI